MRVWITGDGLERLIDMPLVPHVGETIVVGTPAGEMPKFRVERIEYTLPEQAPKGEHGQPLPETFSPDASNIMLFVRKQ